MGGRGGWFIPHPSPCGRAPPGPAPKFPDAPILLLRLKSCTHFPNPISSCFSSWVADHMAIFFPPDSDLLGSPQIPDFSSLSPYHSVAQTPLRLTPSCHLLSRCSQLSCLSSLPIASPPSSHPRQHCHPYALAQDPHPNSGHHFQSWTQTSCVQAQTGSHL